MNIKRAVLCLFLAALALVCLASCNNEPPTPPEEKVYHTVTFNFNNGDETYTTQVEDGKTVSPPISPERENYIFNGWKSAGKEWNFSVQRVQADTAFVAQWIDASSIFSYTPNDDGTVTLTEYKGSLTEIRIPETISGMTVSAIGDRVFESFDDDDAKLITVPETVISIGTAAFKDCSEKKVSILGTISYLGEQAFDGCATLSQINLGEGLSSIPFKAFAGCSSLTELTVPESVSLIGEDAFSGCYSIKTMIIGSESLSIENAAFAGCEQLVTVFYKGNGEKWSSILSSVDDGGNGNGALRSAKVFFYSESEPEGEGDFWYFNDKNEPRCW